MKFQKIETLEDFLNLPKRKRVSWRLDEKRFEFKASLGYTVRPCLEIIRMVICIYAFRLGGKPLLWLQGLQESLTTLGNDLSLQESHLW